MATLTQGVQRYREHNADEVLNDVPAIATDIVYEGAAIGDNGSGFGRPLVAGDPFMGWSIATVDNSLGAAGDKLIRTIQRTTMQLDVVGATGVGDQGEIVYAADDNVFTLTVGTNTPVGKISRYVTGTTCMVYSEALALQSL